MITLTEYVIKYDPRLQGWIGFRVKRVRPSSRQRLESVTRDPLTNPKRRPHLAAQALTRVLFKEDKINAKNT